MKVLKIRHAWPEAADFGIYRPHGIANEYIFLHFWNPMQILYRENMITTFPNACIIFSPGESQRFGSHDSCIHDWMHISEDAGEILDKYGIQANCIYYPHSHEFITEIVRKIEVESKKNDVFSKEIIDCMLNELFARLAREIQNESDNKNINGQIKDQLQRLRYTIYSDCTKHWEISEMAKYINISPSYLHSAYKKLYGVSPTQDLISVRMEQAKSLLAGTQRSVSSIAENLGYANTTHFIRQFTKNVGVSPLKYRHNNLLEKRWLFD